ncbi:MAG: hypothetical protein PWQ20_1877 [Thermotogaceae bacterium]|nr:hypothetical protein [Thermotogaceae bacterium]
MLYKASDSPNLIEEKGIDARRFYESDKAIIAQITLEPGSKLQKHSSDEFALLYVVYGQVEVEIENRVYTLSESELIEFYPGQIHSVANNSSNSARVIVIKIK